MIESKPEGRNSVAAIGVGRMGQHHAKRAAAGRVEAGGVYDANPERAQRSPTSSSARSSRRSRRLWRRASTRRVSRSRTIYHKEMAEPLPSCGCGVPDREAALAQDRTRPRRSRRSPTNRARS